MTIIAVQCKVFYIMYLQNGIYWQLYKFNTWQKIYTFLLILSNIILYIIHIKILSRLLIYSNVNTD